jgi:hypothetical protein
MSPAGAAAKLPADHATWMKTYLIVPVCLFNQEHDALKEPAQREQQLLSMACSDSELSLHPACMGRDARPTSAAQQVLSG